MKSLAILLIGAAVAATQAAAQPAEPDAAAPPAEPDAAAPAPEPFKGEISKEAAEATISQCGERRFETTTETVIDGRTRNAKVLLCAKPTDTDEQWAQTLEKSAAQIESSDALSADAKAKLVGEVKAAIAELRKPKAPPRAAVRTPRDLGEYSVLPPLPPPVTAAPPPALAPLQTTSPGPAAAIARPAPALLNKPRVEVLCAGAGANSAASDCVDLDRDTVFAVRADGDLPGATRLQFARRGSSRSTDVQLSPAGLKSGQTARVRLPGQVCSGIAGGKVEIRVIGAGGANILGSYGPYQLRC